jgi:hypothetical protein
MGQVKPRLHKETMLTPVSKGTLPGESPNLLGFDRATYAWTFAQAGDRSPGDLLRWESAWIDLGGEG